MTEENKRKRHFELNIKNLALVAAIFLLAIGLPIVLLVNFISF